MKDDKYIEEKAKKIQEYIGMINKGAEIYWENFIRQIVEECKPKISRNELSDLASDALDSITTSRVVGLIEVFLKSKDVEIKE